MAATISGETRPEYPALRTSCSIVYFCVQAALPSQQTQPVVGSQPFSKHLHAVTHTVTRVSAARAHVHRSAATSGRNVALYDDRPTSKSMMMPCLPTCDQRRDRFRIITAAPTVCHSRAARQRSTRAVGLLPPPPRTSQSYAFSPSS